MLQAIFERAKKKIEKGWVQRVMQNRNGCCAMGAIVAAVRESGVFLEDISIKVAIKKFRKVNGIGHIVLWNDEIGQSKKNVLAAFDKCIAESV